ncbi:MAG: IS1595 family transposase, partial [Actinobacteria bacterium]|nr:IS1595 family transposase [Actinomycetota bacterium]
MKNVKPAVVISSYRRSYKFFVRLRWPKKRYCPRCISKVLWKLKEKRYKCKRCRYKFGDFTGTYLGKLKIPINEIAHILYLFTLGVPAYRIKEYAEVSLKTIQKVFTTIREAIYNQTIFELKEADISGEIEMDETMFGGKHSGKRGWGASGKNMIFGIYQRNGKVFTFPISSRSKEALLAIIYKHTKPGSLYYTDDWHAYSSLSIRGNHVIITKEKGKPKGRNHLNGIEGFWSFAKNWLYQYRGVPQHHFHLYLKEIEFRFNHRSENLFILFAKLITNLVPNVTQLPT